MSYIDNSFVLEFDKQVFDYVQGSLYLIAFLEGLNAGYLGFWCESDETFDGQEALAKAKQSFDENKQGICQILRFEDNKIYLDCPDWDNQVKVFKKQKDNVEFQNHNFHHHFKMMNTFRF